jgi:hypothetical protein
MSSDILISDFFLHLCKFYCLAPPLSCQALLSSFSSISAFLFFFFIFIACLCQFLHPLVFNHPAFICFPYLSNYSLFLLIHSLFVPLQNLCLIPFIHSSIPSISVPHSINPSLLPSLTRFSFPPVHPLDLSQIPLFPCHVPSPVSPFIVSPFQPNPLIISGLLFVCLTAAANPFVSNLCTHCHHSALPYFVLPFSPYSSSSIIQ